MISRSQMNRQLYQMGGEGMQEGIGSMMGQAMMQPQVQEQEQVPQKDYEKIKQILRQLYQSNPQKFQEFIMKIKGKIPPKVLQELVMSIQQESGGRSMAASGGIMSVPRAQYGFGSFISSALGSVGDFIGSAADAVGDVISGIDLGDVATAAAFYFGGPQAAAMVNSATGGTGNKYLDMGLNLYAGGTGADGSFSLGNIGNSFQSGPGQSPNIFGDFGKFGNVLNTGMNFVDSGNNQGKFNDNNTNGGFDWSSIFNDKNAKILGTLVKEVGIPAYTGYLATKDQKRINDLVEQEMRKI
jgi:hypothetical protein